MSWIRNTAFYYIFIISGVILQHGGQHSQQQHQHQQQQQQSQLQPCEGGSGSQQHASFVAAFPARSADHFLSLSFSNILLRELRNLEQAQFIVGWGGGARRPVWEPEIQFVTQNRSMPPNILIDKRDESWKNLLRWTYLLNAQLFTTKDIFTENGWATQATGALPRDFLISIHKKFATAQVMWEEKRWGVGGAGLL
jgi:hypothetical protein